MNVFHSLCVLFLFSVPSVEAEMLSPKNSLIPDRREFPINNKIDPCNNFHQYACSIVEDSFELRPDRSSHTFAFNDSYERLLLRKKEYFAHLREGKRRPQSAIESEIKNFYSACMNEQARKTEEKMLVERLKKELDALQDRTELLQYIAVKVEDGGMNGLLVLDAEIPNLDRSNYNDVLFNTPTLSLPERSYYFKKEIEEDAISLKTLFFQLIGKNDEEAKNAAIKLFAFEKELSQHYPLPVEIRSLVSERRFLQREEISKKYPELHFDILLKRVPKQTIIRDIIKEETLAFLNQSLKTMPLDDLKNILLFFNLSAYMDDAYPQYIEKKIAFMAKHFGASPVRPVREERCTRLVMSTLGKELDFVLLPQVFPHFPKKRFVQMVEDIRQSLLEQLKENTWLSPKTRDAAIHKLLKIKFMLVAPDNKKQWNFRPFVHYSPENFIANDMMLKKASQNKALAELKGPIDKDRWLMGPLTVNAYYEHSANQIVIPVGILQYPFYDTKKGSEVANLGGIGAVIGHEIGHAIDDEGSKYDSEGRLAEWMTPADRAQFSKRGEKLITQFDRADQNGTLTLGENIGDIVGVTTAHRAAKIKNQEEQKAFFLQWARNWCTVQRDGMAELYKKTDPHADYRERINQQVRQNKDFAKAYNCPIGSPMTLPETDQVRIW